MQPENMAGCPDMSFLLRLLILCLCTLQSAFAQTDARCHFNINQVMVAPELQDNGQRPASGWQTVSLPDMWNTHWPGFNGPVWYKADWQTNCPDATIALTITNMSMTGQVHINNTLLWQGTQESESMPRYWNTPLYLTLPAPVLQEHNTLWFRLIAPPHLLPGLGQVTLGTPDKIMPLYKEQNFFQRYIYYINLIISLTLAELFGIFWLLRRNDHAFGWFTLSSIFWSLWISNVLVTSPWPFSSNLAWDKFNAISLIAYCCTFCMFIWSFAGIRAQRLIRVLWGSAGVATLLILIAPEHWFLSILPLTSILYTLILCANGIQFIIHACRTRDISQLFLAACMVLCMLIVFHTILVNMKLIESSQQYASITSVILSLCLSLILAWRYSNNMRRVASFNEELKTSIAQTREELTRTLQQENALAADNIRLHERLRMTHDLHDSLGSSLMHSISMVDQSSTIGGKQFLSILRELRNDLRHIIDGTSDSIALEHATPTEWIASVRRRFTNMFEDLDMTSEWHIPSQWQGQFTSAQLSELTRFIEEALTNILKHSHARHVLVRIEEAADNQCLILEVSDNGRGFDVDHTITTETGIGIHSMVRRIRRINGTLDITSSPGKTMLTARIHRIQSPT